MQQPSLHLVASKTPSPPSQQGLNAIHQTRRYLQAFLTSVPVFRKVVYRSQLPPLFARASLLPRLAVRPSLTPTRSLCVTPAKSPRNLQQLRHCRHPQLLRPILEVQSARKASTQALPR